MQQKLGCCSELFEIINLAEKTQISGPNVGKGMGTKRHSHVLVQKGGKEQCSRKQQIRLCFVIQ